MANPYSKSFFSGQQDGSAASASVVVPVVLRLFPNVRSVIDVGCGVGGWLRAFQEAGITDVSGVDGEYVPRNLLKFDAAAFHATDLTRFAGSARRFDLALSLEVAEHLPPNAAAGFVAGLVKSAPIVLFSAAIPDQGGTNHINEQWQSYWARLFAAHGYEAVDCIRPSIHGNAAVDSWYRQNTLIYCKAEDFPAGFHAVTSAYELDRVDPGLLHGKGYRSGKEAIRTIGICVGVAAKAIVRKVVRSVLPPRTLQESRLVSAMRRVES